MGKVRLLSIGFALQFIVFSAVTARGQGALGSILGHIQDSSGASVPGAKVTLRNTNTGISQVFTTTTVGDYMFVHLIPGKYVVTVEAKGFKGAVSSELTLQVDLALRQDFTLDVGQITQEVTVTGSTQMLQTASSTVGQVVDNRF